MKEKFDIRCVNALEMWVIRRAIRAHRPYARPLFLHTEPYTVAYVDAVTMLKTNKVHVEIDRITYAINDGLYGHPVRVKRAIACSVGYLFIFREPHLAELL